MAWPLALKPVGAKPPWNQPQVMFLALSRLPTFVPTIETLVVVWSWGFVSTHSSPAGRGSPITGPVSELLAILPDGLAAAPFGLVGNRVAGAVVPPGRLGGPAGGGPHMVAWG